MSGAGKESRRLAAAQHYAMLQRNLLYTGVTRGKRLVVLVEEGRRYRRAQRLGPTALVETGGMVERGRLEALRECMTSGVTVPPWRSRVIWRAERWEQVNCVVSSMLQACPLL